MIAALDAACRQLFKRAPLALLGSCAYAELQVGGLRSKPVKWLPFDIRPLPVGIAALAAERSFDAQGLVCGRVTDRTPDVAQP